MLPRPPISTLFPYTTLFRSEPVVTHGVPHDAGPVMVTVEYHIDRKDRQAFLVALDGLATERRREDRKSTRLNSSHLGSSYAVFCLKKKRTSWQIHSESLTSV